MIAFIKTKELIRLVREEDNEHVTLKDIIDIFADNVGTDSSEAFKKGKVSWHIGLENPYHVGTQEYFDFIKGDRITLAKIAVDE